MKAINTLIELSPYIIASVFIYAMFSLFMEFAKYVERHGL